MRLYNVVVQYDLWIVAKSQEGAFEAASQIIEAGEPPNDKVVYQLRNNRDIRASARDQRPFVAGDVSDQEYDPVRGTVLEVFNALEAPRSDS